MKEEFEDTKGVSRIRTSKNRQHNGQNKEVIRSCKSKDRQFNGQNIKNIRTNNDLQNTTQKTRDQVTKTKDRGIGVL
jgi:hypothetical protein